MIEKQSDNVENLEENVSEESNINQDSSVIEEQTNEDKHITDDTNEKINAEDLKNTISNNDARLEQLEKEHETLKSQYVSCLLYTSPSPRDVEESRMPSSA